MSNSNPKVIDVSSHRLETVEREDVMMMPG